METTYIDFSSNHELAEEEVDRINLGRTDD